MEAISFSLARPAGLHTCPAGRPAGRPAHPRPNLCQLFFVELSTSQNGAQSRMCVLVLRDREKPAARERDFDLSRAASNQSNGGKHSGLKEKS